MLNCEVQFFYADTRMNSVPIIFFDGVCGLCNKSVDFIIRHDQKHIFSFAPLQGETAAKTLPPQDTANLDTLVLLDEKGLHYRSSAALRIAMRLGGALKLFSIFFIIPKFVRDPAYNLVAKNRYRIFGKKDSCRLPTPEERKFFLS